MKLFSSILALGVAASIILTGCSNDSQPDGPNIPTPKFANYATLKSGNAGSYTFTLTASNSFDSVTVTAAQPAFANDARIGNRYVLYYTNSTEESGTPNSMQPGPITLQGYQKLHTADAVYGKASEYNNWSFGQRDGIMVTEMTVSANWLNFNLGSLYTSSPSYSLVVDEASLADGSKIARAYLFNNAQHGGTLELKASGASFNISRIWANEDVKRIEVSFCYMSKVYTLYADKPGAHQTITPIQPN